MLWLDDAGCTNIDGIVISVSDQCTVPAHIPDAGDTSTSHQATARIVFAKLWDQFASEAGVSVNDNRFCEAASFCSVNRYDRSSNRCSNNHQA
jgi:hypothetical protein